MEAAAAAGRPPPAWDMHAHLRTHEGIRRRHEERRAAEETAAREAEEQTPDRAFHVRAGDHQAPGQDEPLISSMGFWRQALVVTVIVSAIGYWSTIRWDRFLSFYGSPRRKGDG